MKVLYGVQCTGNGHITRSFELIKELKKYVKVDIVTSGSHSEIELPYYVRYRLKGLSYYFGKNGSFDLKKTLKSNNIVRFVKEVKRLPLDEYDLIISDFEPISAWAAKLKKKYTAGLSNQVSLLHPSVPKPKKTALLSRLFLKVFCPIDEGYGLLYKKYANNIFHPPIRQVIRDLTPTLGAHYVVYLPCYSDDRIISVLQHVSSVKWVVFSKNVAEDEMHDNVQIKAIAESSFIQYLENCSGVLCTAGFGTTSEAIFLKKKLLVVPMKNQYEQTCNAHILNTLGIPYLQYFNKNTVDQIKEWVAKDSTINIEFKDETGSIVRTILTDYINHSKQVV